MGEICLLDCTLRDGGYVNDWEFGHDNLVNVFERVVSAGVDIIELGFLDDRREFDINRSIMPDTSCMSRIYGELDKGNIMTVGMIDYGTCSLEHIETCSESYLDGIRVIFKKHNRKAAIEYCSKIKKLGYKVFAQLVSITSYSEEELMDVIQLANEIEPYAVSIVDTYGLLHQDTLMHYFKILDQYLLPTIGLGYHSHNNFQLGYANCIEMLSHKVERTVVVDATLYGMGKSAGNTPIELLVMHLNKHYQKNYDITQILEAIDSTIINIYRVTPWGYNMFYYIAASNDCHPNYVSFLMNKRTLSIRSINEILEQLSKEKKLLYDQGYMEELYLKYQKNDFNDDEEVETLKELFQNKRVLLLGPGSSIIMESEVLRSYIEKNNPTVVAVNFIPEGIAIPYMFLSNAKRYVQLATVLSKKGQNIKVIATSNVTKTKGKFDYTLEYSALLDEKAEIVDNSFIMLLKLMIRLGVKKVALGGFDGYTSARKQNYVNSKMEYNFTSEQANRLNEYVSNVLKELKGQLAIEFITDSLYEEDGNGEI